MLGGTSARRSGEDPRTPLCKRLWEWFMGSIGAPTDLQLKAWRSVLDGKNTLVVSPTGSGKTLAAILPALDPIVDGRSGRGSTSVLYISPMRALGADLVKTFNGLSTGLGPFPGRGPPNRRGRKAARPETESPLQVGIRTGDVPQSERRRLVSCPPDLLIITPENLLLMLCSKASEALKSVSFIIVDELHELAGSKRGALLSLSIELLVDRLRRSGMPEPVRIGLSATIKPERTASVFLGGYGMDGRPRSVEVIKEVSRKGMEIEVKVLAGEDRSIEDQGRTRDAVFGEVEGYIRRGPGPLVVFQNTRRGAEEMAYALAQRGLDGIMPHHGSLGPEMRRRAEEGLRSGALKAIISSTSLELGIDIGRVERVLQVSSPRSPIKLIQRFGRSGHGLGRTSRGVIFATGKADLIESVAVLRTAAKGSIERLAIPEAPLDVLAQFMVGASIMEDGLDPSFVRSLARRTAPFRHLRSGELDAVLSLLSERLPGPKHPAPRLWRDGRTGLFRPKKDTRQAFYLNCGTIPKENNYKVFDSGKGTLVGELSWDFAEALYERDVIMLASRSYRVVGFSRAGITAREDPGALPTIPIWTGEGSPRPGVVSRAIYDLYRHLPLRSKGSTGPFLWSMDQGTLDVLKGAIEDLERLGISPSETMIPAERTGPINRRTVHILHIPLGKRSTDILGRLLSYGLRKHFGAAMEYTATDDGLAISSPLVLEADDLVKALPEGPVEPVVRELILTSGTFRSKFAMCMGKALMVLYRFRGRETGIGYRRSSNERLLATALEAARSRSRGEVCDGPMRGLLLLMDEAIDEVLSERSDLERVTKVCSSLREGRTVIGTLPVTATCSFLGSGIMGGWKFGTMRSEDRQGAIRTDVPEGQDRSQIRPTMSNTGTSHGTVPSLIDVSFIKRHRKARSAPYGRFEQVLKRVPFFTHPIEVLCRASSADLNQLRSALKGGRLVPVRSAGRDRMAHPSWAVTFQLLSPPPPKMSRDLILLLLEGRLVTRSEVGEASGTKGDALTSLISALERSNCLVRFPAEAAFHIGAPTDFMARPPPRDMGGSIEEEQCSAMVSFLDLFGPMEMAELAWFFNWDGGHIPPGVQSGLLDGRLHSMEGPQGPMSSWHGRVRSGKGTWLWTEWTDGPEGSPMTVELKLTASTDISGILTGEMVEDLEKDRIRDSLSSLLRSWTTTGDMAVSCRASEQRDLLELREVEAADYSLLGEVPGTIQSIADLYGRLGYEVFCIDRIMGVPSGETTGNVTSSLKYGGWDPVQTARGVVLVKGCPIGSGITREQVLREMLFRQGLLPGSRKRHPLEVLTLLGGLTDRWEILSRLGSSRYRKAIGLTDRKANVLSEKVWEALGEDLALKDIPMEIPSTLELSSTYEGLSDLKDLARKYSLLKVKLDQPSPVWTSEGEAKRYPPPSPFSLMHLDHTTKGFLERLLSVDAEGSSALLRTSGDKGPLEDLVRNGILVEDAWGNHRFLFDDSRFGRPHRKRHELEPRGLRQRKWLLRCARSLGLFTINDLLNYSPDLEDPSKVRAILNEMSKGPIPRRLAFDIGPVIVYGIETPEASAGRMAGPGPASGTGLTIISPKDRMARVLSGDIRALLSRRQGFMVFKGIKVLSTVSLSRPTSAVSDDGEAKPTMRSGPGKMTIKKIWMDLRLRRSTLLKDIKKAFFEHGFSVLTSEEETEVADLYRELEPSER